jgi:hypothetical protein
MSALRALPIDDTIAVNGIVVSATALPMLVNAVTNPDPRRWYRFERQGDSIIVHTKWETENK